MAETSALSRPRLYSDHGSGKPEISGYIWLSGPQMADQVPAYVLEAFENEPVIGVLVHVHKDGRDGWSYWRRMVDEP